MKYLGGKSLSPVLSVILGVLWYVVLVIAMFIFDNSGAGFDDFKDISIDDWNEFMAIPLFLQVLMLPYFSATMIFLLLIIRNCRMLFRNLKNEKVYYEINVFLISKISKLLIVFSVLTFKLFLIVVALLLFLAAENTEKKKNSVHQNRGPDVDTGKSDGL